MKSIFFTAYIIFTLHSYAQVIDTINWSSDYKLKFEDFQGKADITAKYKAVSSIGINYKLSYNQKSFSFNILCSFNKNQSWMNSRDSTLLEHERTHFNIAELFARKLNQAFKNYKPYNPNTIQEEFKKIAAQLKEQRKKMDDLYDKETNLSRNKSKQLYWDKKITSQLKLLESYK